MLAIVAAIGCGKDRSAGDAAVHDAPLGAACEATPECAADEWCNPGPERCEPRSSALEFDRDIYPTILTDCVACHLPGAIGTADSGGSGVAAIFSEGPAATYAVLLAGGTDCTSGPHRVCVDEPRDSMTVLRLLPGSMEHGMALEYPGGYQHEWIQLLMRWIAAGAPRDGGLPPDAGVDPVPDAGLPDGPTCDGTQTPTEDACVVSEPFGVFVAPPGSGGSDATGNGSRAAPYASLARALTEAHAADKRVYACNGTFVGDVTIDASLDGLEIYGGLRCADWQVDTTGKAVLRAATEGTALVIDGLVEGVTLSDLRVVARDSVTAGTSSIAVLVHGSEHVVLVRSELVAGRGMAGAAAGETSTFEVGVNGGRGVSGCPCDPSYEDCSACDPIISDTCPSHGTRTCGTTDVSGGWTTYFDSSPGLPADMSGGASGYTAYYSCYYGAMECTPGQPGADGDDGPPMPNGAASRGEMAATGWRGDDGGAGAQGLPGQGGGGGGGGTTDSGSYCSMGGGGDPASCADPEIYPDEPGGGTGGSGGCGGVGGAGGGAGGASIALAVHHFVGTPAVQLVACTLIASTGGAGGNGGPGATGERGGYGGAGGNGPLPYPFHMRGCGGGDGGTGGTGAAGGGGGGGHSAAIVYAGRAPDRDAATLLAFGTAGAGGLSGAGALGLGAAGLGRDVLSVDVDDSVPPTGGGVITGSVNSCAAVTLTFAAATDNYTDPAEIERAICWSPTPGACLAAATWVRRATSVGPGAFIGSLPAEYGRTVYFSARPADLAGNLGALPVTEVMVTFPARFSGTSGAINATAAAQFEQYHVTWAPVTHSCPTETVSISVCAGTSCTAVTPSSATTAVVSADCTTTQFSVQVNDTTGLAPVVRSKSADWPVQFSSVLLAYNYDPPEASVLRCTDCHPNANWPGPTLTIADVNASTHAAPAGNCPGYRLIVPSNPMASDIYRVASNNERVCGGAHGPGDMSPEHVEKLRCWIMQGALP